MNENNNSTHYDTLGVSKDAGLDEIKKAFRVLSMKTHPDTSKDSTTTERFKNVSQAYRILSNTRERKLYDLEIKRATVFGGFRNSNNTTGGRTPPPGVNNIFLESLFRPRNVLLGLTFGFLGGVFLRLYIGGNNDDENKKKRLLKSYEGKATVEAWKNPKTGQWELPSPWNPTYRKLNPTLQFVPREQVAIPKQQQPGRR